MIRCSACRVHFYIQATLLCDVFHDCFSHRGAADIAETDDECGGCHDVESLGETYTTTDGKNSKEKSVRSDKSSSKCKIARDREVKGDERVVVAVEREGKK